MADSKISELTALTTPASDDVLAIVDTSAGVTKKITISNLATSSEVVEDTSPQLGGDLDVNGNDITSSGNLTLDIAGNLNIDVDGTTNLDVVDIDGALTQDGGAVFNEASADVDFRVESNNNEHKLFVDGGNNVVIISGGDGGSGTVPVPINTNGGTDPTFQLQGANNANGYSMHLMGGINAQNAAPAIYFSKSRSNTLGQHTILQNGDRIGELVFCPADGNDRNSVAAFICADVDGTPGENDVPGRLEFHTTADGAHTSTERMRIDSSGNVGIGTSSPNRPLSVYGNAELDGVATASPQLAFRQNGTDKAYLTYWDSSDTLALTDGSANGLHFSPSTGKVGIGTTSPDSLLTMSASVPIIKLIDSDDNSFSRVYHSAGSLYFDADKGNGVGSSKIQFGVDDTERMRITSAGKVGIGTTSPNSMFEVRDNASPTIRVTDGDANNITHMQADGANGGYFGTLTSHDVRIAPNNSTKLIVKVDGKVGIGTTSPSGNLHIVSGGSTGTLNSDADELVVQGTRGGLSILSNNGEPNTIAFGDVSDADVGKLIYDHGSNAMTFTTNTSERMRILANGNVGIGTTSPAHDLDILKTGSGDESKLRVGSTGASGVNNAIIKIDSGGTGTAMLRFDYEGSGDRARIGTTTSGQALQFFTAGDNERMSIKSNGDIEFGSFSTDGSSTGVSFEIGGSSAPEIYSSAQGTATRVHYQFYNDNGIVGKITTNGTATSFTTSSDYRLKENVITDWNGTTRLKQLKPSRFNFKADADTTVDGFLAHEVSDIVPEAISGDKDAVDSDGNAVYQGIDQSKLVPLLVKTIQELEARITTLENN